MMLSMNIHPTRGGVAPLYNARNPSLCMVCFTQSKGPLKRPSAFPDVCKRTLTVSDIPFISIHIEAYQSGALLPNGCPTASLVMPEATPAANPRKRLYND